MNLKTLQASVPVLLVAMLANGASNECRADWPFPLLRPDGAQRVDVIGPVGSRLPESYRRQYNRPTYVGGKTAAIIAPSSQEARAWQRADALGLYDDNGIKGAVHGKHCPPKRVEQHYFYPKPWEVLTVGPRRSVAVEPNDVDRYQEPVLMKEVAEELEKAETLHRPSPDDLEPIESAIPAPVQDPATDALDLNDQSSIPNTIREPVFVAPVSGLIHR
ncbi:putative signal peptide protein [Rhodopirellula islandica]|uniref:Signal peptide protein n=1 Tax=Rhodopirellula islandica TaxID=595434 RepID=A0A0J1EGU2_RHOIS|nr:hypothetical protein [Rhodopirellula islandica]KLU04759.1 putative signal peptide protein [Rhodopirellula islandica]